MLKSEHYDIETKELSGVPIRVTSYRIGDRFHCHVENTDPGATIARAEGPTKEQAVEIALSKARERLK
ncbi:MAG: hypothetical protein AAB393_05680 [Bacteroidota bacterium]